MADEKKTQQKEDEVSAQPKDIKAPRTVPLEGDDIKAPRTVPLEG